MASSIAPKMPPISDDMYAAERAAGFAALRHRESIQHR